MFTTRVDFSSSDSNVQSSNTLGSLEEMRGQEANLEWSKSQPQVERTHPQIERLDPLSLNPTQVQNFSIQGQESTESINPRSIACTISRPRVESVLTLGQEIQHEIRTMADQAMTKAWSPNTRRTV